MIIIKKLCFLKNYNSSKGITWPGCLSHHYFKQKDIKFCTRTIQALQKYCTQLNKWYFNQHHAALTAWSSNWYQWKFIFLKFLHLIAMKAISWLPFIFMKFHKKLFTKPTQLFSYFFWCLYDPEGICHVVSFWNLKD